MDLEPAVTAGGGDFGAGSGFDNDDDIDKCEVDDRLYRSWETGTHSYESCEGIAGGLTSYLSQLANFTPSRHNGCGSDDDKDYVIVPGARTGRDGVGDGADGNADEGRRD